CLGMAFSNAAGQAYFIELNDKTDWAQLKPIFESKNLKTGYDVKKCIKFLDGKGLTIEGEFFDVLIAHFLVRPESNHSIPDIASTVLGIGIVEFGAETRKPLKEQYS